VPPGYRKPKPRPPADGRPSTTRLSLMVNSDLLARAETTTAMLAMPTVHAQVRQLVWALAEQQPMLPGMPPVGRYPEARAIAERVHQAHYGEDDHNTWDHCGERVCVVLRRELGLR